MSDLRDLDESTFEVVPWRSPLVSFVAIQSGGLTYAKTVTEKRTMLSSLKPRAKLIMSWPGQWSQDVFDITRWRHQIEL